VSIHCVFKVSNLASYCTSPSEGYDCVKHVGMQQTFSSHTTKFSFHLNQQICLITAINVSNLIVILVRYHTQLGSGTLSPGVHMVPQNLLLIFAILQFYNKCFIHGHRIPLCCMLRRRYHYCYFCLC
jgi:hypothetical protein